VRITECEEYVVNGDTKLNQQPPIWLSSSLWLQ